MTRTTLFFLMMLSTQFSCSITKEDARSNAMVVSKETTNRVVLSTEIQWEKLNPARGDKSPQAGTIWGDRKGEVATGFLAKFVDGFSSPPHIHNVTYRAMVVKGLIHNDDPDAEKMWMPPGSFWTQPAGEAHITAAKGEEVIAYVEIDSGPYLVKPTEQAFDNGERPINVDKNNIIWLDASQLKMIETSESTLSPLIAFLWEAGDMSGKLLKLPVGYEGTIFSEGTQFHAVLITGESNYIMPKNNDVKSLDPGSYFTSTGNSTHTLKAKAETVIYIRTNGALNIK